MLQKLARNSSGNEYNSRYPSAITENKGLTEDNKMIEDNDTTELIQLIKDIGRKLELLEIKHPHSVSENTTLDTCTATTDAKEMNTNNGKYFCVWLKMQTQKWILRID